MEKRGLIRQLESMFIVLLIVLFAACSLAAPTFAEDKPIKIGVLLARTGPFTTLCGHVLDGFNLYMEETGYKVAGRTVEVIVEDEGPGDPSFAMDRLRKLVESDKVDMIVGPFNSDLRLATLAYTSKKKIPSFAAVCDDEGALKFPYSYTFDQTTFQESRPLGWYAFDELGIKTVNTIGGDWHAGRAFIEGFVQGFTKERGGEVLKQQFAPIGTTDFSSYIVAMKPADAIAIMSLPNDVAAFLAQAAQMGVVEKTKILIMGQTVMPQMLPDLGPSLLGRTWGIAEYQYRYDNPANKTFVDNYTKKFGHMPMNLEGSGYVTGQVAVEALRATNGDVDPDKLHGAIKALNINTPMGPITFTEGNPDKSGVQGVVSRFIEEVKKADDGNHYWELVHEYKAVEPAPVMK